MKSLILIIISLICVKFIYSQDSISVEITNPIINESEFNIDLQIINNTKMNYVFITNYTVENELENYDKINQFFYLNFYRDTDSINKMNILKFLPKQIEFKKFNKNYLFINSGKKISMTLNLYDYLSKYEIGCLKFAFSLNKYNKMSLNVYQIGVLTFKDKPLLKKIKKGKYYIWRGNIETPKVLVKNNYYKN